jgi:glycine hydroxymethyltransferase
MKNSTNKKLPPLDEFDWSPSKQEDLKKTALYETHKTAGAKIIAFAGWEMPVWYSSVIDEHQAVRNASGLFDVSHMGVFEACGEHAGIFLDGVCGNDISGLENGESCYTHFLDPNAKVIDDLLVYRHLPDQYLLVVNAANREKDWAWLNAVKEGIVLIDKDRPWIRCMGGKVNLKDLNTGKSTGDQKVDIALQGPLSRDILLRIGFNAADTQKILGLQRTNLCHAEWKDDDLIISRTGYTGEKMAFEIFVHPKKSIKLWNKLIEVGSPLGLKPCGLGARDSLRTEAGLPLYGHEMGGEYELGVGEAGFGSYVKVYKPWFIGRSAYIKNEKSRANEVVRFQFEQKRTRIAHLGDKVFNNKGKNIGFVTSCAIDKDGFLTGQAYIEKKFSAQDSIIYIYQNTNDQKPIIFDELNKGDKIALPSKAIIRKRFPRL